jgi:hypothetical protein
MRLALLQTHKNAAQQSMFHDNPIIFYTDPLDINNPQKNAMDFDGTGMPLSEAAAVGRARLQEVARQRSFRARVGQPLLGCEQ